MKIVYDVTIYSFQKSGGGSVFGQNSLDAIKAMCL